MHGEADRPKSPPCPRCKSRRTERADKQLHKLQVARLRDMGSPVDIDVTDWWRCTNCALRWSTQQPNPDL